jgi:hypothetical protein
LIILLGSSSGRSLAHDSETVAWCFLHHATVLLTGTLAANLITRPERADFLGVTGERLLDLPK